MANALEKTRWPFALAKTRWLFQRVRGALTKRVLGSLGSERYCMYIFLENEDVFIADLSCRILEL